MVAQVWNITRQYSRQFGIVFVLMLLLAGGIVLKSCFVPAPAQEFGIGGAELPVDAVRILQDVPTPTDLPQGDWMPPPMPGPVSIRPEDHFWFSRPIASDHIFYPHPYYRYGNTYFGNMTVHSGIDLKAGTGTEVRAAGDGMVVWAGWGLYSGKEGNTSDPYGIAVVIKHDFGYKGQELYTLYAHNSQVLVVKDQHVQAGEIIALSGTTGRSTGPHVHFEVRVGRNSFYTSRNPELWLVPLTGHGTIAGRLLNRDGSYATNVKFTITRTSNQREFQMWSYSERVANRDNEYQENFVLSDLPEGTYLIRAKLNDGWHQAQVEVVQGRTTFVIMQEGGAEEVQPAQPRATNGPIP